MPKKKDTIGSLKKKLQMVFNKYCKTRDCVEYTNNKPGELGAECISCSKWYPFEKMHGGHFWASTYSSLRFDERNVNAQCGFYCNLSKSGNFGEYRIGMIKKYGLEVVEELENKRNETVKWSLPVLREQIKYYKDKLNELT